MLFLKVLILQGLSSAGKGESSPVVDCTNCSKDEDQLNRRSEFIITAGNPGE
jgi:outer membrane protein OmpA-like peptidoglycan-associated protein